MVKREKRHSITESECEKSSPVAVLEGPEHSRSKIWRWLSFVKLLSPFFRSADDLAEVDECLSNFDDQKPSWKCFSYEEISHATNNFRQGENELCILLMRTITDNIHS